MSFLAVRRKRLEVALISMALSLALGGCVAEAYHQLPSSAHQDAAQTDVEIHSNLTVAKARDCIVAFESRQGDASVLVRPMGDQGWKIMEPPNQGYQDPRSLEIEPGNVAGTSTVVDHGLLRWVRNGPDFLANMDAKCERT